jgi:hypothetical protein
MGEEEEEELSWSGLNGAHAQRALP